MTCRSVKPADGSRSIGALALSAALTALAAAPCYAQEATGLDLSWEAPLGCPSGDVVRKRVRTLVGPALDSTSRVRAEGRIERSGPRYRLTLRMGERGEYERVIESASCSDLAGAAAVALALLVRGELEPESTTDNVNTTSDANASASSEPGSDGKPDAAPPAQAIPEKPRDVSPVPPAAEHARSRFVLLRAPLAGVDIGPLPSPNPTLGLAIGIRIDGLELSLGARLGPTQQTAHTEDSLTYGAKFTRFTSELRGCYLFAQNVVKVGPCLLASVHVLSVEGLGREITPYSERAVGFAAGAGASAKLPLSEAFALLVSAGLEIPTTRERVVVNNGGEVAKAGPVAVSFSGGFEWAP
jgi:hypothetical protein